METFDIRIVGRTESGDARHPVPYIVTPRGRLPVYLAGTASTALPTAAGNGQEVDAYFDANGRLHVVVEGGQTHNTTFLNATASGDTQVVALTVGQRIRVVWLIISNQGASVIAVHLRSANTAITGNIDLAADGGGFTINTHPGFFCQTEEGEALDINLSAVGTVSITLGYVLI